MGMTSQVHAFDAREGGFFRISLTCAAPDAQGKSSAHTDTHHGRFIELVPNQRVVEVVEFETEDPAMRGEMTITYSLTDAEGGTEFVAVHEGVPPGVPPADNEAGWRSSLAKLATLRMCRRAIPSRSTPMPTMCQSIWDDGLLQSPNIIDYS
jgi:uncharacterized protein YndB with AHSA1/START domain